jgi:murein DD-endopeptidase MepM/ murein hydrolase activator NlpD
MSKEKEILDILSLYESILETKSINEVSNASNELFGGSSVAIPADGAHGNQSGWQSQNAWDIKAAIGTPVYAVIGGTLKTYTDYGPTPIHKDGKTLFGAGFTVDSNDNLPDVYYTHLKDVTVRQGDKIECGQLLGYVMDFPNSDYDHLHIGVESGNVRQFLNPDGTLKCANGQTISGTTVTGSGSETEDASEKAYNDATGASKNSTGSFWNTGSNDTFIQQAAKSVADKLLPGDKGLKEQREFGNDVSNRYGRIIIPKDTNPKIKSPASGVIDNSRYVSGCVNQVIILTKSNHYLQFCGISKPSVTNGQSISRGTILGSTDTDVEVTMFDDSWNTVPIQSNTSSSFNKNTEDDEKDKKKKETPEKYYEDPLVAMLAHLPSKMIDKVFGDRYDKKTGEMTQKRWGGVADKRPVDPWVIDAIKKPFTKKVNENIDRIKKLL